MSDIAIDSTANNILLIQANGFLERLMTMDHASQQAFRRIYELAPKIAEPGKMPSPVAIGRHVRVAMLESLTHPDIAHWVRVNLALRIGLKFAQTTQQTRRATRLENVLEAFHVATEAHLLAISVEHAWRKRSDSVTPEQRAAWKRVTESYELGDGQADPALM